MTTSNTVHLNDEQFTDLLMELGVSPATAAHLAACELCQAEQRRFLATMEDFNGAALAFMDTRMEPWQPEAPVPAKNPDRRLTWAPAGFAFAAVALVAVSIPAVRHFNAHEDHAAISPAAVAAPVDSAATIASDNRMLQDVAVALAAEDDLPLSGYHAQPGALETRKR